ncbi:MAG: peptidoglycan-binding domain-containing protein [Pyrinomonadaceae bacterium]
MPNQKVGDSESTSSLAKKKGFYWKTIKERGENAALYQKRKDPNVLAADDDIFIPELVKKTVSKGTESEHVFKRKGEPTKIKMKLLELGEPRKNAAYIFECGDKLVNGTTDGEGILEQFVPGEAKAAKLYFKEGKEIHGLRIGSLDPHDLASGIVQRLNNCGFKFAASGIKKGMSAKEAFDDGKVGNKGVRALKNFQAQNELEPSGKLDDATIAKFEELCK